MSGETAGTADGRLQLQRMTTEFVAVQDRLCLRGELPGGGVVVLWMTQRLLNRLVPALCAWLEAATAAVSPVSSTGAAPSSQAPLQHWEQQAAQLQLPAQAPVQVEPTSLQWLVEAVDVEQAAQWVRLTFRAEAQTSVSVVFQASPLRQWLGIVFQQYGQAEWATGHWPSWMAGTPAKAAAAVLH